MVSRNRPKAKPARPRQVSHVKTYVPKAPPAAKYIDLDEIFSSHGSMSEPIVTCRKTDDGGIEFHSHVTLEEIHSKGDPFAIEDLISMGLTNGKEEAMFLRALADLIDATK
jgi:hypothetical protein